MTSPIRSSSLYANLEAFTDSGFLVVESLFDCNEYQSHIQELNSFSDSHLDFHACSSSSVLVGVLLQDGLHQILCSIFGHASYSLHHFSSTIHIGEKPSLAWHHDKVPIYWRHPQSIADTMVHVLYYPNGIAPNSGELLLVPKSHKWAVDRYQLSSLPLEALKCVSISRLPPGSVVIINSSLIHARRSSNANAKSFHKRYLIDLSFCSSYSKWEPYLESRQDFRKTFALLKSQTNTDQPPSSHLHYLSLRPYLPTKLFSIFPWPIVKPLYKLLSFYSRRLLHPVHIIKRSAGF